MDDTMTGFLKYILILFLFTACATKQPKRASSATILIKTPTMKFYDKGFISKFDEYTQVQIFSAGTAVLNLEIYSDRICISTFKCQSLKEFNRLNLDASYPDNFLQKLFDKSEKKSIFRDTNKGILIKIIRD